MFNSIERLIAFRYLKSRKKQGFISVIALFSLLGVAFGVAALIVVMAVMNGFHHEISAKMTGFNGDIVVSGRYGGITDFDDISAKINTIPGVNSSIPVIEGQVMVTSQNYSSGSLVKAMRLTDLTGKKLIADNIIRGSLRNFEGNNVALGYELAASLRVGINDYVTLISPKGSYTAVGMVPRLKQYKVIALFKSGMYQYDSGTVIMPFETAQIYFKLQKKTSQIEVNLRDQNKSTKIASEINKALDNQYYISDWKETNATYFNVLKTERIVMFVILALIILVAAFNIISSLIMLVQDKAKDIAILRTMGMSKKSIIKIFFLCGSLIGIIGTTLGLLIGLTIALNIENIRKLLEKMTGSVIFDPVIYYLSALPSDVQTGDVVNVVVLSLSLSFLATIYPAKKAASLDPVQGLRYE